ncbi:MAG TPA: hypothetical protein VND92_07570 [Vicinamibacterales bacterium]|nr:hypothetical protein [Vicinamibacterales bacterium]
MSDRKYRQRGYQDDDRRAPTAPKPAQQKHERPEGPRTPNLMGYREVFRCARCGNLLALPVAADGRCKRCGVDLHACIQCVSFDAGQRFECAQPIKARISPKDTRNSCALFAPRTTIERETGSTAPTDARQAFDDLFK